MSMSTTTSTGTKSDPSASEMAEQGLQSAKEHGAATAAAVRQEAASVAASAAEHAKSLVGTAGEELKVQGRSQTDRLAEALRGVSEELGRMASDAEQATPLVRVVGTLSDATGQLAGRLDDGGPEGVVADVSRFARCRPGTFLLASVAAGFATARLIRSTDTEVLKEAASPDGGSTADAGQQGSAPTAGNPEPAPMPAVTPSSTTAGANGGPL